MDTWLRAQECLRLQIEYDFFDILLEQFARTTQAAISSLQLPHRVRIRARIPVSFRQFFFSFSLARDCFPFY